MSAPDVIVLGEPLVEVSTTTGFAAGTACRLGFSGDALNAAAAGVAAGAHVALLACVSRDELGDALLAFADGLGIDTTLVRRVDAPAGVYFVHADPAGERSFCYARSHSAGTRLTPADVRRARVEKAGVVVASGITSAISQSASAAVTAAAQASRRFVYDPNFRPRLVGAAAAGRTLEGLAPHATLVTPSAPAEAHALLGVSDPFEVVRRLRTLGAAAVAVTRGADGVLLDDGQRLIELPAVPAHEVVDQTGAGDAFTGTVAAGLAAGEGLEAAVRAGIAAASRALSHAGGIRSSSPPA